MDKSQQLVELIRLAEQHGFKLPDGLEVADVEIRNENGYSLFCGRHYDIERILFDPEFHKALWRSKRQEVGNGLAYGCPLCTYDGMWGGVHEHWESSIVHLPLLPDRIEYLAKTFLE